jgi:hypothetical protein
MTHRTTSTWTARVTAVAVLVGGAALGPAPAGSAGAAPVRPTSTTATVDDPVATHLTFNREEERMARDLYRLLARTYRVRVFGNIAASEQAHFTAVGTLLTAYGIDDPSAGLPAGTYADPTLQTLYDQLRARGLTSLAAAYQVGATVERRDIADLEASLADLDQADIRRVLTRLVAASQRHLAAFERAAARPPSTGVGQGPRRGHPKGQGGRGLRHGRGPEGGRRAACG